MMFPLSGLDCLASALTAAVDTVLHLLASAQVGLAIHLCLCRVLEPRSAACPGESLFAPAGLLCQTASVGARKALFFSHMPSAVAPTSLSADELSTLMISIP